MTRVRITVDGRPFDAELIEDDDGRAVKVGEHTFRLDRVQTGPATDRRIEVTLDGDTVAVERQDLFHVRVDQTVHAVRIDDVTAAGGAGVVGAAGARIHPPMPGKIVALRVDVGQEVTAGEVLLVLEAMKMQNEVTSPAAGVVREIHVQAGANVDAGDVLVTIGPPDEAA